MGVVDFLTIILLAVAIITLVFMGWETSLTRKQMRGEVYSRARVKDLYFLLPATCQREVEGFKQEDGEERSLGEYIAIPVGLERELHICWEIAETQNLRGYRIRFEGNSGNKPEILGMERAFRKKILQTYGSEEFIDWNGDFHREYARQLRCPKGSCHYVALRVRGMAEGKYSMHVRVRMDEAPKPFEGKLTVDCLSQPNDWAEQHWAEEHIR